MPQNAAQALALLREGPRAVPGTRGAGDPALSWLYHHGYATRVRDSHRDQTIYHLATRPTRDWQTTLGGLAIVALPSAGTALILYALKVNV